MIFSLTHLVLSGRVIVQHLSFVGDTKQNIVNTYQRCRTESLNKEYSYRVKIAADCNADHLAVIEQALGKYNVISVADFKRKPISENPVEFARTKGVKLVSEVCSTDIVTGYPVNPRILEVWLAVNLGLDHDRVLCYDVKEPRRHFADQAEERMENDNKIKNR